MTVARAAPIDTFTVGFGADFPADELDPARETARRLGSRHHELRISAAEYEEFLPRAVEMLEEPVATTSSLAFHRLCVAARREVKVLVTGQGADEPFAGYPRYVGERLGPLWRALPAAVRGALLRPLVERLPRLERLKHGARALGEEAPVERMAAAYAVFDERQRAELWADGGRLLADAREPVRRWLAEAEHLDGLSRMLYVDARLGLADNLLLYTDKMSMAASLEARVPFLDHELMAFAESLPSRLKLRALRGKLLLRRAVRPWVPRRTRARPKRGFETPVDAWLRRGALGDLERRLAGPDSACAGLFDGGVVRRLIDEHRGGRRDHTKRLFALVTLELWHAAFFR
jgi:asparagine synthase (glutamine-hydrolysing)